MSFVIRVRTSQGMHRFNFASKLATFADLQAKVTDKYYIQTEHQILSKTPPNDPNFIESSSTTLLTALGLKHGDIIYLILAKNQLQTLQQHEKQLKNKQLSGSPTQEESKSQDYTNSNSNSKSKYTLKPLSKKKVHGGAHVTLATSKWVNDPDNKMVDSGPKHVSFHEWIEKRQKKYAKKAWLIDPPKFDYKSVPYRNNLEFKQLPPNAVVMRQVYRHVDMISFKDISPFFRFKTEWEKNDCQLQQSCYLIGRYEKAPNTLKKSIKQQSLNANVKPNLLKNKKLEEPTRFLMTANVYAIYEPPQRKSIRGVKFLKEKDEKLVDRIIEACGMQRVGWSITTMPRGDEKKYHGDIFMSCEEIFNAARFQEKYKNKNTGYSKFVTLVTHMGDKEAQAYQISDQGVTMIKHGLIGVDKDPGFMLVKEPPEKVYVPSVINENSQIKPGNTFLPDALLVNVMVTKAKTQEHIFNYVHFPAQGSIDHLRKHLTHHRLEEFHQSLSDFYLLTYLPKIIDIELAVKIAEHVVQKKRMPDELRNQVTAAFRKAIPGWK